MPQSARTAQTKVLIAIGVPTAAGTIELARQLKRTVLICVALATASLIVTASSIAGGLLTNESWSWLPAFSVIGFGMSVSAVVFNYVRYARCCCGPRWCAV